MAMMIPDYALVAEVMLFSEGFEDSKALSRKMVNLYKLSSEQLSQQVRGLGAPAGDPGPLAANCSAEHWGGSVSPLVLAGRQAGYCSVQGTLLLR